MKPEGPAPNPNNVVHLRPLSICNSGGTSLRQLFGKKESEVFVSSFFFFLRIFCDNFGVAKSANGSHFIGPGS